MNKTEELLKKLELENIKLAPFSKRLIAYIIDTVVIALIVFFILYGQFDESSSELEILAVVNNFTIGLLLLQFCYHSLFCALYGASLGKIALKIMIIDAATLDRPNILKSMLRALVRQASDSSFCLGFAWALSNKALKTWQDYAANTVVIDLA